MVETAPYNRYVPDRQPRPAISNMSVLKVRMRVDIYSPVVGVRYTDKNAAPS